MAAEPLRMDLSKIAPDAYRHFLQLEGIIGQHVERKLLHLLKLRASQINGCAFCIGMHSGDSKESFEALKAHFSEEEIAWLTLAAVQINAWNRMAISSRAQYDRAMFAHAAPAERTPQPA